MKKLLLLLFIPLLISCNSDDKSNEIPPQLLGLWECDYYLKKDGNKQPVSEGLFYKFNSDYTVQITKWQDCYCYTTSFTIEGNRIKWMYKFDDFTDYEDFTFSFDKDHLVISEKALVYYWKKADTTTPE